MKKKKKTIKKREGIILSFIVITTIMSILILNYEKDCGFDQSCINDAAQKCTKATVLRVEDANILRYQVLGRSGEDCRIKVTIEDVSPLASFETRHLFEGKSMTCDIPKNVQIAESKEIIAYCSGPLKESIYELIIKKMYNYVALNLGEIISGLEQS